MISGDVSRDVSQVFDLYIYPFNRLCAEDEMPRTAVLIGKPTIPRMHWMKHIEDNEAKALQIKSKRMKKDLNYTVSSHVKVFPVRWDSFSSVQKYSQT